MRNWQHWNNIMSSKVLCSISGRGLAVRHNDTQLATLEEFDYGPAWTGNQQLRLAFENSTVSLTAGIFCAFVIVVLLWPVVDNRGLILWLGAISVLTLLRLMMQQTYERKKITPEDYDLWHHGFVASAFSSGCTWGALSLFLFPETSVLHQAYLTFVIGGVCAGAVSVYAPLPYAFAAFTLPVLIPYAARIWMINSDDGNLMAGLIAIFALILMRTARESRKNVQDILDLQVRNADLTRALHHRATHDSLVNLINHGEFNRRLERLTRDDRRANSEFSLIFIDLDLFKEVNDTGGHAAGDLVLKGVANILRGRIRAGDTAARVGGDEFALLLDGCPHNRALEIADAIRKDIADFCIEYEGMQFSVEASIGVSYGQAGVHSATGMLKAADAACYSAKEAGRNRVCINPASDLFQTTDRFELAHATTVRR
jgi:diguanylate cyclase (GGDEF)-like protein